MIAPCRVLNSFRYNNLLKSCTSAIYSSRIRYTIQSSPPCQMITKSYGTAVGKYSEPKLVTQYGFEVETDDFEYQDDIDALIDSAISKEEIKFAVEEEHIKDSARGPRTTADYLVNILNGNDESIKLQMKRFPMVARQSAKRSSFLNELWQEVGLTQEDIANNVWLLMRSADLVKSRRRFLEYLTATRNLSVGDLEPWARVPLIGVFPRKRILYYMDLNARLGHGKLDFLNEFHERVDYYAEELDASCFLFIRMGLRHPFLYSLPFLRLKQYIDMLKNEGGQSSSDILTDLWALKHSYDVSEERIKLLNKLRIPIKTWMLRCSECTLVEAVKIWEFKASIFGSYDPSPYLQERLGINEEDVTMMQFKNRSLFSIKPRKLKAMLDLLLDEGIPISEIVSQPRVLSYSVATVQKRCLQLKIVRAAHPHIRLVDVSLPKEKFTQLIHLYENDMVNVKKSHVHGNPVNSP